MVTASPWTRTGPGRGPSRAWIVGLVAFALLGLAASEREPWRTDEHRYIEVSREMATSGEWLAPRLNARPYLDKPAGFFWLAGGAFRLGLPLALAGILPSVLGAALSLALCFEIARRAFGPREAWSSVAVLGSIQLFTSLALRANLDAFLCGFVTSCFFGLWRALEEPAGSRWRWMAVAGVAAGLGILVKGPVALAIPGAALATLALLGGRELRVSGRGLLALALGCLTPVALWLAATGWSVGGDYLAQLVWGQGVGHPLGHVDKLRPWWFYLKDFPGSLLPWSVFLPALAARFARRDLERGECFAVAWVVGPLVLLSLFPAKRHLYALPLTPGVALLMARMLESGWPRTRAFRFAWETGRIVLALAATGLGALCLGVLVLGGSGHADRVARLWPPWAVLAQSGFGTLPVVASLVAGLVLLGGGALALAGQAPSAVRRGLLAIGFGVLVLLAGVFAPLESRGRSSVPFYREVEGVVGSDPLFVYGTSDFAPHWTLGRDRISFLTRRQEALARLRATGRSAWLIAESDSVRRLGELPGTEVVLRVPRALEPPMLLLHWNPTKELESDGQGSSSAAPRSGAGRSPRDRTRGRVDGSG